MNTIFKRSLSLVMAVLMVVSYIPTSAFATGVEECEHAYNVTESVAPTCDGEGYETYVCSYCGDTYSEVTADALGHDYAETDRVEATCGEAGYVSYTCGVCNGSYSEELAALGHTYAQSVTKDATCAEAGEVTFTCSVCGDSYTEEIASNGHSYAESETKEATCTEAGSVVKVCSACGDTQEEIIPAAGHSYNAEGKCAVCGTPVPECTCETPCTDAVNAECGLCALERTLCKAVASTSEQAPLSYAEFNALIREAAEANLIYDGNGIEVILKDSERSYQNNNTAQFFIGATNVNITDPVEFVSVKNVTFTFVDDDETNTYTSGELQIFAKGVAFFDCTFNGVAVSPWGMSNAENAENAVFQRCIWKNLSGRYAIHQNRASNLTVGGCVFDNCERGIHTNSSTVATIRINGNTFTGIGDAYGVLCLAENGDLSAATLTIANNSAEGQVLLRQLNRTTTVAQVSAILNNNTYGTAYVSGSIEPAEPVAYIGETLYTSLQAAVDAANGDKIELCDDVVLEDTLVIPAGKTVVLDLGSHTISQEKACTGNYSMILNKGNLTITGNGTISFNDTGAGDPNFGWGSYTLRNEGTLVIENTGITIEHLGQQNVGGVKHMYCAIFQYSGSSTIKGGTISTPTYRSVRLWKGDMDIQGGNFQGQVWVQAVDNSAKLTISGNTARFQPTEGIDSSSVYVENSQYEVAFSVTGGFFHTKIGCSNAAKLAGSVSGGLFTPAAKEGTNAALIKTGYELSRDGEQGPYAVVPFKPIQSEQDTTTKVDVPEDVEVTGEVLETVVNNAKAEIAANTAVQQVTGLTENTDNMAAAQETSEQLIAKLVESGKIKKNEDIASVEPVMSIQVKGITGEGEAVTKLSFDVEPQVKVTVGSGENTASFTEKIATTAEITFNLPLPKGFAKFVNVYHGDKLIAGAAEVTEGADGNYITVKASSFSPFTVEEADPVAIISGTDVKVFNLDDAFTDEVNPGKNAVIMVSDYTGDVTIESGFYSFYLNGHTMTGTFKLDGGTVQFYGNLNDSSNPGKIVNTGLDGKYAVWCSNGNFNIGSNVIIEATGENGVAAYSDGNKMIISGDVTVNGDVMTGGYGILEISNGTYNGSLIKAANTSLEVTGGKFSEDPSGFIPTGYTTKVENGYYNVVVDEITLDKLSQDNEGAYLIKTPDDVVIFRTLLNVSEGKNILSGKVFKLANDIDMADYTLPAAGSDSKRFMGTFDGQNHTISNINIEASNVNYVAFFGNISGATIKDLTLNNVTVVGGSYTAGLVGFTRNSTIENCAITGSISIAGTTHVGGIHAGGVVTIKDCEVNGTGTISGEWDVGGISGLISAGSTDISGNTVSGITVTSEIGYTGGIAGRVLVGDDKSITLADNAVNNVTITAKTAEYSSAILVGAMQTDKASVILDCNAASGATLTVAGEEKTNLYDTDCDNNSNVTITVPVAYIGNQSFKTLDAALKAAAATEDQTVIQLAAGEFEFGSVKFPAVLKNVTIKGAENKTTVVKNSYFYSADGNAATYDGITFDGIVFDNSSMTFTGNRNGEVVYKDWTITNCEFKNVVLTKDSAIHFNLASDEAFENLTFTNNVIDGVSGGNFSGLRANYVTGDVVITGNTIKNVAWNAVQIINSKTDTFTVEGNTFASGADEGLLNLFNVTSDTLSITGNKFLVKENQPGVCYITNADVSGNYWNGGEPVGLPAGVTCKNYFADETMNNLVKIGLDGNGTEAAPYQIATAEDLFIFAKKVNNGTYKNVHAVLTADIDLNNEEWTPIGYMGKTFNGTFDGGSKTIKNLKITKALDNATENNGIGLFGRTDSAAVIQNLTIENVDITGSLYVGAVVGYGYTGNAVRNVTVKGDIAIDAWWYAGVIGGNGYMNLVDNCHVIGNNDSYVKGNNGSYIGGIWGFRGEGSNKITNCSVTNVDIIGVDRVGGICGIGHYGNEISGCTASGVTVTATDPNATTVGLIVGACQGTATEPTNFTKNTLTNTTAQIDNGDGTYTAVTDLYGTNINGTAGVTNYVAKIGDTYYDTVIEALTAAIDNGASEVKILTDVREKMPDDFELVIKNDLTITADTSVKVEFYNEGTSYDFVVGSANNNTLTIAENVHFDLTDRVIWLGYYGNNVDVQVDGYLGGYQIWHGADTTVSETGTLDSHGEAFIMRRDATMTVNGGKVNANYFHIYSGHIIATNNADIDAGLVWIYNNHNYGSEGTVSMSLTNTTFDSNGEVKVYAGEGKTVEIKLDNGTTFTAKGALTTDAATTIVADSGSSFNAKNESAFKATVGEMQYTSLQAAVDAAAAGETVTMLEDIVLTETLTISADKTITLALNGKTVTGTPTVAGAYSVICNNGDLTITDSVGGGKILCDYKLEASTVYDVSAIYNSGKLTVLCGTIETVTNEGQCGAAIENHSAASAADLEIQGGTLSTSGSAYLSAIYMSCESKDNANAVTVTGGTMGSIWMKNATKDKENVNGALHISAGTVGVVVLEPSSAFDVSITGGTIEYVEPNHYDPTTDAESLPTRVVTGGTFVKQCDEMFLAKGYYFEKNDSNTFDVKKDTKNIYILNLGDLKAFRDDVNAGNTYAGVTVHLDADIDLNNEEWTPIATFNGYFDGDNHIISNLVVNGGSKSNQGFFGQTNNGEIKNLTIHNAKVSGYLNVGVVAGTPYTSKYTNIKVTGHVEVNGFAYVGGVGGKNAYANWTDITVDADSTSYVKANSVNASGTAYRTYVGGVVGFNGEGGHTFKNISSNIKVIGSTCDIGGLFGIAHYSNNFENVTFTGSVEAPAGAEEVGGIAGVWHNEKGTSVTFSDVSSTGTVIVGGEDVSAECGVVGGAYTASNDAPANSGTLIINGNKEWPIVAKVGDKEFGNLQAAINAAENGDTITVLADITLSDTVVIPAGKTVTLELNGKTVSMVYAKDATANHTMLKNQGNLTIQDSVGGGKLSYQYTGASLGTSYSANTVTSEPGSVLTVKSGTIENLTYDSGIIAYAIDGLTNGGIGDVTVNIEGGTITSQRQAVRIFANSTTKTGTLNISGGDITGRVIVQNSNANANKAALAITGGTFNPNAYMTDVLYVGGSNSATIAIGATVTGGTFNGAITKTNVKGFISGGIFTSDPSNYLADGYTIKSNSDGSYGVKAANEAWILRNDVPKFYASLAEAIADAKGGETVILMANVTIDDVLKIDKNITISDYGTLTVKFAGKGAIHVTGTNELTLDKIKLSNAPIYGDTVEAGAKVNGKEIKGIETQPAHVTSDGTTVELTNPAWAAKIGSKYYMSFQEALAAVKAGGTLELLTDVTITEDWDSRSYVPTGEITINGNGNTLKFTGKISDGFNYLAAFRFEAPATLNDLTIDMSEAVAVFQNRFSAISAKADLTVNKCNFIGSTTYASSRAIIFGEGADVAAQKVEVTNSIFTNWRYGVVDNMNAKDTASEVTMTGNEFTDASVQISAQKNVIFNGNIVAEGSFVDIRSYAADTQLTVSVAENTIPKHEKTMVSNLADYEGLAGTFIIDVPATITDSTGKTEYFNTLAQALTAAEAGETVTLLCDLALVDTITIAKSITLDGNGHKLTPADATKTYNSAIMAGDSGWGDDHGETITLKNIVFDGWNTKHGVVRAQGVTLNVDTCEFKGCSVSNDAYGVLSLNFTDATVEKSKFVSNTSRAIDINYNADDSNAVVTIDGCEFTGNTSTGAGIVVRNDGEKLVVKNSTFKNNVVNTNGNAATLYAGWGDADEITGNTFEDNTVTTSHATTKRFASAIFCDGCTVTGNVFSGNTATRNGESITTTVAVAAYYGAADVSGNYWDSKIPTAGVDYTVEYSKNPVAVTTYCPTTDVTQTVPTGYVAQVGKYSYATLPEAIAAAESGQTVKLMRDVSATVMPTADSTNNSDNCLIYIPAGKTIALDLNGKTIAVTGNPEAKYDTLAIRNNGNLTITDTSDAKAGKITFTNTATQEVGKSQIHSTILNFGTLTIEAGTIENTAVAGYGRYAIYSYSWGGNADVTVKNGTIYNATSVAIYADGYSDYDKYKCNVTIDGGDIQGGLWYNSQNTKNEANLTITGGTFTGDEYAALTIRNVPNNAVISGGTFNGEVSITEGVNPISGGTFTTDVAAYCAKGYTTEKNSDGTYGIKIDTSKLYVSCDYTSATPNYGVNFFNNYQGAYNYATTYSKNATIVVEKTNTLSGNCFDNNHKNYGKLAVVIKDGATMGVASSKWDMTYPVTVEPGGAIVTARPASAGYINSHIKNTLTIGAADSDKVATVDFLSDSYKGGSIAVLYNGKIIANNAKIEVEDMGFTGNATFTDCDITVDGVLATGKNNYYKQSMTDTTVTVNGHNKMNENTYYSTEGTVLNNLTLTNSTITVDDGNDATVAEKVTVKNVTLNNSNLEVEEAAAIGYNGTIKVDGNNAVAAIGVDFFTALPAAIAAAEAGDTVTLLSDVTLDDLIKIEKAITIDLGGKKVTTNAKKAFEVYANATIKNGTIEAANRCVDTRKAVALTLTDVNLIADKYTSEHLNPQPLTIGGSENGTKVTMTNVNISAEGGYGIITFVKTDLTATNSTIGGYSALYVKPGSEGSTFEFVNTDLSGSTDDNDVAGNSFSTIAVRADDVTVNVDAESSVTATGNYCSAISLGGEYDGEEIVTGANVIVLGDITGDVLDASSLTDNTVAVKAEYADVLNAAGYAVSAADANGMITVKGEAVAAINGKNYESLQVAINAAQNGDTVTILAGEHTEGTIKLPAALKNVTIKGAEGAILKDMTISAADGNSYSYVGLTFDGITFDNSRILLTGWRNGEETIEDLTITNCIFKNLDDTTNSAPVHINKDATEAVKNFTFTNNVIDGATGGSKSGVYAQVTGKTTFTGNTINNVSFRPYVIQLTTDDGVADEFIVTGNTFSGSAVGRAQGLGSNAAGTDTVKLEVSENIFKGITDAQQICYWNFNPETTTADLSKNYYDIDILNNPSKIYFNGAATNAADLVEMAVYPYYADEAMTEQVEVPAIMVTYPVGNPVFPDGKIEYYNNMLDAVPYTTNCPRLEGATITLLKDTSGAGMRFMENDMVFDLNGHTYTITAGTGSQGTNTSGFQIRPEVTTDVIFKNGTIKVAEGAPVVWMFNSYAADFVVEDVTVDCTNMAWSYGESCYVAVSRSGDNVQFTGTTKVENFNSAVAGNAINVGGTMTIADTVDLTGLTVELDAGATLIAPAGLDVVTADGHHVVYNNGVYSTLKTVATINDEPYASLLDALKAAKNGETVVLLADVELSAPITVKNGITIDGSGKTITQSAECNNDIALLYFEDAGDVTIKNVTFDGLKTGAAIRTLRANITIDNCVFQNCEHTVGQGLVRLTMGNATVKNSKFINNNCSMGISFNWDAADNADDTLTVDNCEFTGNTANATALVYYVKGAKCTLNNNKFIGNKVNCSSNGAVVYMGFTENNVITGNLFQDNVVTEATTSTRVAGAIFFGYETDISGNAFINNTASNANGDTLGQVCTSTYYNATIDLSDNYWGGKEPVYGKDYTIQHQTGDAAFKLDSYYTACDVDSNGNMTLSNLVETDFAAQVGKLYYNSLEAAVAAVKEGETIKLLSDVELVDLIKIEKAITLDLGGKKVTTDAKKAFEVYADATIKNGTIEAANRCVDTREAVALTLTGVKLIADEYTTYGNPQPLTIGGSEHGTEVTMTNVTISAEAGYGIITFVKTDLTATDSNISGYNALYVKPGSEGSTFNFKKTTLSGSTGNNDVEGNSFSTIAVRADDVTVNVDAYSSVTATGNYCCAISLGGDYTGEETVTGAEVIVNGTIKGNVLDASSLTGNTVTIKAEYADELSEDGYAHIVNNDGTITAAVAAAKIGETCFVSLQAAVDAAVEGDRITVLKSGEIALVKKAIVIDHNEFEVTVAALAGYTVVESNGVSTVIKSSDYMANAGDPVAYVDINNDGYNGEVLTTLQAALNAAASGDTIKLYTDAELKIADATIIIPTGVTLDIESHTVQVKNLIGLNGSKLGAQTMLKDGTTGKLIVPQSNLVLSAAPAELDDHAVVPLWDETNNYYFFVKFNPYTTLNGHGLKFFTDANGKESLEFRFRHYATATVDNTIFSQGVTKYGASIIVRLTWNVGDDDGIAYQDFVFKDAFVQKVAGATNLDYIFTLNGYDVLGITEENITIQAMVLTDCGLEVEDTLYTLENAIF